MNTKQLEHLVIDDTIRQFECENCGLVKYEGHEKELDSTANCCDMPNFWAV